MSTTENIKGGAVISIEKIIASKTNPRQSFDDEGIKDLAASIAANGLLQPILVRPVNGEGRYEIVCGERRWRATKQAGLGTIRCVVRDLDDLQALQAQVVENLQRQDLSPIEEAEGYATLMKNKSGPSMTLQAVADRVGKSKGYVHARLKLLELPDNARKALREGKINVTTAILIGRIPDAALRKKATQEITQGWGIWNPQEAKDHVQRNYMTMLKDAPFDPQDTTLCPKAGACTNCPKRTINAKELFADFAKDDLCTDPACFAAKRDAAWKKMSHTAEEKGQLVLDAKQTAKVFPYNNETPVESSGYIALSKDCHMGTKSESWEKLLRNDMPQVTLARTTSGNVVKLVKRADAVAALKKKGYKFRDEGDDGRQSGSDEASKQRKKTLLMAEVVSRAMAKIVAHVEGWADDEANLRMFFDLSLNRLSFDQVRLVVKRRNLPKDAGDYRRSDALTKHAKELNKGQLRGLIVELFASAFPWSRYGGGFNETFAKLAAHCDVNLKSLEADVLKETQARAGKKSAKGQKVIKGVKA